ncbi:MAG: DUF452 family protein [Paramuribaculum sp.]|nr:DUF452 family protein [Paramuribaculum sp.]
MKYALVSRQHSRRLIIMFAGWGMDESPFSELSLAGYDIAVVWDYSDEDLHVPFWDNYDEICVLAWSYGVYFAGRFISEHPGLPITARVAVNGTMHPVHDRFGIPPVMYKATLNALSAAAVKKFYRRMCGGAAAFESFRRKIPQRTVESLTAELDAIGTKYVEDGAPQCDWDTAFVCDSDLIFPPGAQKAAWQGRAEIIELPGAHLPDFQRLLRRAFILKDGVSDAFTRSLLTYNENAPAQLAVANHLAVLIAEKAPLHGNVIEIGCGSGFLTQKIVPLLAPDAALTLIDVSPIDASLPGKHIHADAEIEVMKLGDCSVSAILSSSAVQWFNSPATFLREAGRILCPGGLLAIAVYSDSTFAQIPGHESPSRTFTLQSLKNIVPREFEVTVCEEEEYVQQFESPRELLRHFRLTGVAPANNSPVASVVARKIISGNVTALSYNPIFLLLTKKKYCNFVD